MPTRASQILVHIASTLLSCFLLAATALALEPGEVLVLANVNASSSLKLAKYYMQQRGIPEENLVRLSTVTSERCSRMEYDNKIRRPLRSFLAKRDTKPAVRCLVSMYGLPLAIDAVPAAKEPGAAPSPGPPTPPTPGAPMDDRASVDAELALVLTEDYPLASWLPNPYYLGFQQQTTKLKRDEVLMVSRLDGPDADTVVRLIDDAIATEKTGLQGKAYFDARWPAPPKEQQLSGYALYDASLHHAAEKISQTGRMPVQLDEREALFQPGEAPQAALYCGWYSLSCYVDAFTWVRGAIGYHIASGECTTLKRPESQVWCKRMLERGIAATIGPVNEPYVQAFPLPELFFPLLAEGYLSLGETYLVTLPFLSWQMVLIGDPLYQPFKPVRR